MFCVLTDHWPGVAGAAMVGVATEPGWDRPGLHQYVSAWTMTWHQQIFQMNSQYWWQTSAASHITASVLLLNKQHRELKSSLLRHFMCSLFWRTLFSPCSLECRIYLVSWEDEWRISNRVWIDSWKKFINGQVSDKISLISLKYLSFEDTRVANYFLNLSQFPIIFFKLNAP